MKYGSVCSGIEAATVAWHPLGWRPSFFSEIDAFPRALLTQKYPDVPLHGDFTTIKENDYEPIDLLVGGTPCQSFSVAGLRKGLDDERGNLTLEFIHLAQRLRPRWLVWENVPGVLSQDKGRAFGAFLGGLAECGYGFAYRVLDAQHFGVPQRRRRVFVIGHLGDWRCAAAVLFERESLRGDITPRRETREATAGTIGARTGRSVGTQDAACGHMIPEISLTLLGKGNSSHDGTLETYVAHALRGEGFDASEDGTGRGMPLVPCIAGTLKSNNGGGGFGSDPSETFIPIAAFKGGQGAKAGGIGYDENVAPILSAAETGTNRSPTLMQGAAVRRLTPRECERLQGFPDDYTLIQNRGKPAADGPRYKAIGNSMAAPVMAWIGQRIQMIEDLA